MKQKLKLHFMLIVTGLLFTLLNPAWHVLEAIRSHAHQPLNIPDLLTLWGETCLAIGAFSIVIALLTPAFSRVLLGYESKKPDEGDEIYFFVVLTLFILGLCFMGARLLQPPHRDLEKDLKYVCGILNDNDLDLSSNAEAQKLDTICPDEPTQSEPEKE